MADEDNVERTDSRSASHKRNDASGDADARSDAGTQSDTDAQNDDDSQSDAETQSDDDTQNDADAQSNAETQDDDDTQSDDDAQSDTDSSISEEAAMPLPDHVKNPPPSEETQEETLPTQTQGAPPPPTGTEPAPPPPVELPPSSPIRVEMPFLDHLEELRWRILKSLAALIIGAVVCFSFSDPIFNLLKYPYEDAVFSLESDRSSGAVRAIQNLLQEWMGQRESGAELGDRFAVDQHPAGGVETAGRIEQARIDIGDLARRLFAAAHGHPDVSPSFSARLGKRPAKVSRQAMRTATPISTCS